MLAIRLGEPYNEFVTRHCGVRTKFIMLVIGMLAYGWYLHAFADKAQLQVNQLQHSYEQAINTASQY